MLPVVTPEEMAAIDAAAPEPVEVLIGRAGAAVAREALRLLGGTYGRRVVVVAGKGNNGNDGRDAAARLTRRGVRVVVVPAGEPVPALGGRPDLLIDAAYGTGFRGSYEAPDLGRVPVLAVDVPSGVDGLTGEISGTPAAAVRTVAFAALKPGLLFAPGRQLAGDVVVADIGLDVSPSRCGLVTRADVARWVPPRPPVAHKWQAAVVLVAGSPGMTGAAHLVARAAQRAGAGMVQVASPGVGDDPGRPTEAVGLPEVPDTDWADAIVSHLDRAGALVVGPGLGRTDATIASIRGLVAAAGDVPLLLDGDALTALGTAAAEILAARPVPPGGSAAPAASADVAAGRGAATVLTPHDGEFARLAGAAPGADRVGSARALAERASAVVLLKGPTTVVAHPDGRARIVTAGDARLATAGTGDVLSGCIGALLARGLDPFDAAAAGAWLHATAAHLGPAEGLVASDVVAALPAALSRLRPEGDGDVGVAFGGSFERKGFRGEGMG